MSYTKSMRRDWHFLLRDCTGFTLVEIMIALLVSSFLLAALYTSFTAQQRTYFVNERVTEMQENLRAAGLMMSKEIRMAGYDPTGNAGAGIVAAGPFSFNFQQDLNGDGDYNDANENITYGFPSTVDGNNDGIADNVPGGDLYRVVGGVVDPDKDVIAQNIEAIGFAYAYADSSGQIVADSSGNPIWAVDASGGGRLDLNLDTNGDGSLDATDDTNGDKLLDGQTISPGIDLAQIRAVRVWILARSSLPARNFTDTSTYVVGRNVITPSGADASYHHRLLDTIIECRNMGL